jgi:hypothetical protein
MQALQRRWEPAHTWQVLAPLMKREKEIRKPRARGLRGMERAVPMRKRAEMEAVLRGLAAARDALAHHLLHGRGQGPEVVLG